MSGIYIPDMEMPTRGHTVTLTICADGYTIIEFRDAGKQTAKVEKYTSVPVPEHGRLIDADFLLAEYDHIHIGKPGGARLLIANAPTIIPADKEEGECH